MSGPKARCPSCGSEWETPVIFCGECGAPIPPAASRPGSSPDFGDRAARLPGAPVGIDMDAGQVEGPKPGGRLNRAATLVGALPGIPVSPNDAPPPPIGKLAADKKSAAPTETRRTVVGMPAVASAETPVTMITSAAPFERETKPVEREAKPTRRESSGGKRSRRVVGSSSDESTRSEARAATPPADETPQIEVSVAPLSGPIESTAAPIPEATAVPSAAAAEAATPAPAPAPEAAPAPPPEPPRRLPPSVPPSAEADETQRLLDDLDAGFESIVRPSAPLVWIGSPPSDPGQPPPEAPAAPAAAAGPGPEAAAMPMSEGSQQRAARHEADMAEVRELFAGIAVAYATPVRDFMLEVAWGEPTREWLDIAQPAASALRRAAAAVELPALDAALEGYATALELAAGEPAVNREVREMLSGAYAKLVEVMPSVFALEGERGRREPIIVRSLLLQVPGVHKVAIDKLYAAGIHSLDVLYAARPREMAEATGLDLPVAEAICERFQRHRTESSELVPGKDRAKERAALEKLTKELVLLHGEHERASAAWGGDADARRAAARKARADKVLEIDVLLAHMGEVDLQKAVAKLPFQHKIRELERYLAEAKQKASRT